MEQAKKQLHTAAFVVLLFAGLSLLQVIGELLFGELNTAQIPEGSPDNILLITKMILLGVSLVALLPKFYVGIKGLRIAKNPTPTKSHIIWATIIFVFSLLCLVDPTVALVKRGGVYENLSALGSILLEVLVYHDYIKCAKKVANLAE